MYLEFMKKEQIKCITDKIPTEKNTRNFVSIERLSYQIIEKYILINNKKTR